MTGTDISVIALVIGLATGLIEIIKLLINKFFNQTRDKRDESFEKMKSEISRLHNMHNMFDSDGTPLWYVPRSLSENQKEILKYISDVVHTQKEISKSLEKLVDIINHMEKK